MLEKLQIREEDKNKPEVVVELYNKFTGSRLRAEFLVGRGDGNPSDIKRWKRDIKNAEKKLEQLREQVPNIAEMVEAFKNERERA